MLTIGHSYVIPANRALAHGIQRQFGDAWRVEVAAPKSVPAGRDLRAARLEVAPGEPCPVHPLGTHLAWKVHTSLYGRELKALLAQGWDLVHAWQEPYTLAGLQLARWTPPGTPLVFRSAQSLPKRYPPPFNWVERYATRRMAGWICSGTLVEQNLLSRPGYADRPHAVIPLGVDTQVFRPDPAARLATLARLGWAEDGLSVVGYLGRFVPEKGLAVLFAALDRLAASWRCLLVGAGPDEPAVRAWAAKHPDAVRVLTDVTHAQVPGVLPAMDVMACPSLTARRWKEQFGRMIVEAFAAGVPVVGSDSGEIPFVIGEAGVVTPEGDAGALAAALAGLLADPERRQQLAGAGRRRAEAEFAWPVVCQKYCDFFERVRAAHEKAPAGG